MSTDLDDVTVGSADVGDLVSGAGLQGQGGGQLSEGRGPDGGGGHGSLALHGRVGLGHVGARAHVHVGTLGKGEEKGGDYI